MTSRAMWGVAAAAAIAFVVFANRGFPAVDRDSEGQVGAARAIGRPQIDKADVVLDGIEQRNRLRSGVNSTPLGRPRQVKRMVGRALEERAGVAGPGDVTALLLASSHGNRKALDQLVRVVYDRLRALARARLRGERWAHTRSARSSTKGS